MTNVPNYDVYSQPSRGTPLPSTPRQSTPSNNPFLPEKYQYPLKKAVVRKVKYVRK